TIDEADPAKSSFDFTVKTDSVDTANPARDSHLKNTAFFNAKQFPAITFKSRSAASAGPGKLEVTGDLTLHGVTKPVVLDVVLSDEAVDPKEWGGNTHRGAKVSGTINRKDFGLTWQKQLDKGGVVAGEDVALQINAELVKKK
ncbi:MAG TPA: YceI family protein, partial [Myxococcota bacterium]